MQGTGVEMQKIRPQATPKNCSLWLINGHIRNDSSGI